MIKGRMPIWACGPFFCLSLVACGDSTAPGAAENREFENTAEMLDSAPHELDGIDENAVRDPASSGPGENGLAD